MLNTFQAKRPETTEAQISVGHQISVKQGNRKSKKWTVSEIHRTNTIKIFKNLESNNQ